MSIFKETLRDFVITQLKIRESIVEQGNSPTKFRHRFGSPKVKIRDKNITIDPGAFYTNTVHKQCVIRMASGVDIIDPEFLEEKEKVMGNNLAKTYVLEGGILDNDKPRGGKFGESKGAYGDKSIRSSAADGFGIVPMPGIIDADIRTKTAYGSLREAKVNFVCHSRRQLEVLEILYMRPGMPVLLEWGWNPYINNKGKIDQSTPTIIDDFFKSENYMKTLQDNIRKQIEISGGNYDGFIGTCKNFEITARPDGGYDCTTELIAMGECLEGLKAKRDGDIITRENEEMEVDSLEFLLEAFLELGEYKGGSKNITNEDYDKTSYGNKITNFWIFGDMDKDAQEYDEATASAKTLANFVNKLKDANVDKLFGIQDFKSVNVESGEINKEELRSQLSKLRNFNAGRLKHYFLFKGETIKHEKSAWSTPSSNFDELYKSKDTYVRWDFLCLMMNLFVFPEVKENKEALLELTYEQTLEDKIVDDKMQYKKEYLEFAPYRIPNFGAYSKMLGVKNVTNNTDTGFFNRYKEVKKVNVENLLNSSFNPKVCLLPSQIPDSANLSKVGENYTQYIGLIHLNVSHLKQVYMSMAYDSEGIRSSDFSMFDYIQKIWNDVNISCGDRHNFTLHCPENIGRIIDLQANEDTLKLLQEKDLYELKIQGTQSIVRDFNFNTTIPSAFTSTVAVAAQAPASIDDLDSVTFANFNKGIKSRFTVTKETEVDQEQIDKYKETQLKQYFSLKDRYKKQVIQLAFYKNLIDQGRYIQDGTKPNIEAFSTVISLSKSVENTLNQILKRNPSTGIPFKQIPKRRGAVVPLKFNAQIDGIGGIIIGNVFKIEKEKLPKGYQDEDIVFVIFTESQKITSGQDWTTEFSGQLMLLDGEDKYDTSALFNNTPIQLENLETKIDNTRVVQPIIEDEIIEDTAPTVGDIVLPETLVGNTGLTQEQINNGGLDTTKRRVNGKTPYDYAYIIQAATNPQNGALSEEFFKGNTSNVNTINSYINKLKQQYGSVFQYNFNIGDFPSLDNQNVGSAFPTYNLWITYFTNNFSNLV